jgi:PAS domain S-box-containing protein
MAESERDKKRDPKADPSTDRPSDRYVPRTSERVRVAETARSQTAEQLRAVLSNAPVVLFTTDAEGTITLADGQGLTALGVDAAELLGRQTDEIFGAMPITTAEGERVAGREFFARALAGREVSGSTPIDGRHFDVRLVPSRGSGGDVLGLYGVATDVTERVRAEEVLRRSDASLRALIDAVPDLIVVVRGEAIVYVNGGAVRTLGHDPTELLGRPFMDLVHPEDRGIAELAAEEAGGDKPPAARPVRWLTRSGEARATEQMVLPIAYDGEPAIVIIAHDVTERNAIQSKLLQTDRMAALGTLAAGVAHEINNPLTYVLVNLEHVTRQLRATVAGNPFDTLTPEEFRSRIVGYVDSLTHATEGANRVKQIARDLLIFSQGNVVHRTLVDVRGLVESAIQLAWHEIRHRARLVKNTRPVPPVEANEVRLAQVFLNLLVNAAQAIPEGSANRNEVRVTTRTDEGGSVVVEVEDTGAGIPADVLPRIFDPFFTTRPAGSGTGLGLSISHGVITSLGGEMTVESAPGKGTRFRVKLPAASGYGAQSFTAVRRTQPPMPRRRVLVVDDDPMVATALARALSDEHDVEVVHQAVEALDLIKAEKRYDVILCDVMMPVMTGMDLYSEVVRVAPDLVGKIVFLTGGAFTARARAFLDSIGNVCLEKPIDMTKLREVVRRGGKRL